ncbi:MAG: hypothetical protein PVG03_18300 [Desulfarculaceae bacterium]|jgi:hypothetical protein
MSVGKKIAILAAIVLLSYGLSIPWQHISKPYYLGFLPAPIFYAVIVHVLFVALLAYLAFFNRIHGRAEDEDRFLAECDAEEVKK